jgi:hypothetical protein
VPLKWDTIITNYPTRRHSKLGHSSFFFTHPLPIHPDSFTDSAKLASVLYDDYVPINEDILFLRTVTQSISKTTIETKALKKLHIFDVSGLKGHRKAWLPYFDDCNVILYMVSLSSIDMTLLEDPTVNRMLDALVLFEQTSMNPMLQNCEFILFLNKKDLFAEKVATFKLSTIFPQYLGSDYHLIEYTQFLRKKFKKTFKGNRELVIHVTCATSTSSISVIINTVTSNLLSNALGI